MIRRLAFALVFGGFLVPGWSALAQRPAKVVLASPQASPIKSESVEVTPPSPQPVEATRTESRARVAEAKRSTDRPEALPRQTDSTSRRDPIAARGRFANPGGVGRYSEYYTAYTPTSQVDTRRPAPVRFDQGAGPDRAEQIAAFRAGQQRTRNIQNNINAYGTPYGAYGAGLGFGFGLATGGLYGGGFR